MSVTTGVNGIIETNGVIEIGIGKGIPLVEIALGTVIVIVITIGVGTTTDGDDHIQRTETTRRRKFHLMTM